MEKQGEIRSDITPSEDGVKTASEEQLEDHLTKRTSDAAQEKMASQSPPTTGCCNKNCNCK